MTLGSNSGKLPVTSAQLVDSRGEINDFPV